MNTPYPIRVCELPDAALLHRYRDSGAYTDCCATEIDRSVPQAEFVAAFYTTCLFKLERWVLASFFAKPSSDRQAQDLAFGNSDAFAAWTVEGRRDDQLLMCDFQGRTRSWLMSVAIPNDSSMSTRLYFGSAVVPIVNRASGRKSMGFAFRPLLGFHRIYSQALLRATVARLLRK